MSTQTASADCLVCDAPFTIDAAWEKGEIIECASCGQEHEVAETTPERTRIELAPEVEEDWGE
ncbi:lysine biosynthesis protein LysW [Glycomyces rhizosphaerae]|uniref:Lysine biosynthesis protein LysW n=1 Tax=Glycomyces rhizosphaerae TaxID=2054422 RepID=A0ABV7PYV1_9ACTN